MEPRLIFEVKPEHMYHWQAAVTLGRCQLPDEISNCERIANGADHEQGLLEVIRDWDTRIAGIQFVFTDHLGSNHGF